MSRPDGSSTEPGAATGADDTSKLRGRREIPLTRVQILTDVVFASAMTMMAMTIELPAPDVVASEGEILRFVLEQLPRFALYGITFLIIAVYWFKHLEHFSYYRKTSQAHLWLQIFYLMFLVIIPFTNQFSISFEGVRAVQILYSLNLLGVGLFSFLAWSYATRDHRLVDPDLDPTLIGSIRAEALVEPVVAVVSIGCAFISSTLWELSFLLVPLMFALRKKLRQRSRG